MSDQAHFSIARGVDMLGFPEATLRVLPSDDRFRLRAETVAAAIAEDRAAGLTPFCIAPVAGSTNTGSVDPVNELADLAEREGLWLHVDAAYGGAVRLSARDADRVTGLERADSRHDRPAQVVLPALRHRRAVGEAPGGPAAHVPPGTRVLPGRGSRRISRCTGTSSRSRARGGSARSSSGCRGSTWGRRGSAG